jgi:hypothetical protein
MHFTRSAYPDIPGATAISSPCWQLTSRCLWLDVDWNTRPPFGASLGLKLGEGQPRPGGWGLTLDINPPIGEPNRLHLQLGRWSVILGLPSVRDFRVTGREVTLPSGKRVIAGEHFSNWLHPHIDGCSRYRYHQDTSGAWVRNSKPEPLHWGWLTISRLPDE